MSSEKHEEKVNIKFTMRTTIIVGIIFAVLLLVPISLDLFMQKKYEDKIYPNVYIGPHYVGGMSFDEAKVHIDDNLATYDQFTIKFFNYESEKEEEIQFSNKIESENMSQQLLTFNLEDSLYDALLYGRSESVIQNFFKRIFVFQNQKNIDIRYDLKENSLKEYIADSIDEFEKTAVNARFIIGEAGEITYIDSENGFELLNESFDYRDNVYVSIQRGLPISFSIEHEIIQPEITIEDLNEIDIKDQLAQITQKGEVLVNIIESVDKPDDINTSLKIKPTVYQDWIIPQKDENLDDIVLTLDEKSAKEHFENVLLPYIEIKPENAVFEQDENGKVITFKPSKDGKTLDFDIYFSNLKETLFVNQEVIAPVIAPITVAKPEISTGESNNLGIKEIIGTGTSNFSGSPYNRRVNIAVGARLMNLQLVAPEEEFSTMSTLTPIDGRNGYLEELVIKGDRTIPEYGGGLCQIGTTTFRAVLNAGLKVTERRNHSYRVRYYEPAGTDATLYDPAPDFKFVNDTENHVLLVTKIIGDTVLYEIWGTKDGRKSIVNDPIIYNITEPPPTKYIETDELEPGEEDCIESAHNGATAKLTRKVIYADGTEHDDEWISYYKPWQKVCLVGADPNKTITEEEV